MRVPSVHPFRFSRHYPKRDNHFACVWCIFDGLFYIIQDIISKYRSISIAGQAPSNAPSYCKFKLQAFSWQAVFHKFYLKILISSVLLFNLTHQPTLYDSTLPRLTSINPPFQNPSNSTHWCSSATTSEVWRWAKVSVSVFTPATASARRWSMCRGPQMETCPRRSGPRPHRPRRGQSVSVATSTSLVFYLGEDRNIPKYQRETFLNLGDRNTPKHQGETFWGPLHFTTFRIFVIRIF